MDVDIDQAVRGCLTVCGPHFNQAHVFLDDEAAVSLASTYGYMLETLRVSNIFALRPNLDPLACHSPLTPVNNRKSVFLISRFVHEQVSVITDLVARGDFNSVLVCTPLTQAAHLEVYSQNFSDCARVLVEATRLLQTQPFPKLRVLVQTLPILTRSVFSGVLLLPPSASSFLSFSPPPSFSLPSSLPSFPSSLPSFPSSLPSFPSSLSAIPAALQAGFGKTKSLSTMLCAQYLASLCLQFSWIPEIFSLGEGDARELGHAFSALCPLPAEHTPRVSFVIMDRRWDLVSPCSHTENVLDYIIQLDKGFVALSPLQDVSFLSSSSSSSSSSTSTATSSSSSSSSLSSSILSPTHSMLSSSFSSSSPLPSSLYESKTPALPSFIVEMLLDLQPLESSVLGSHLLCFDRTQSKEAAMLTEALLTFPEREAVATLCKLLLTVMKKHSIALPPAPPKATPLEKAKLLLQLFSQTPDKMWRNAALVKCALLVVAAVESVHQLHWPMLRALEASMTLEGVDDACLFRITDLLDHVPMVDVLAQACYAYSLRGSVGFSPETEAEFVRRLANKLGQEDALEIVDGWKQRLQEVGFAREVQGAVTSSLLNLQSQDGYTPLVVRLLKLLVPPEGYASPLPELHPHGGLRVPLPMKDGSAKEVVGGLFAAGKMFTSKLLQGVKDPGRHPADNSTLVVFVLGGVTTQEMGAVQQFRLKHSGKQIYLASTGVCSLASGVAQALTSAVLSC